MCPPIPLPLSAFLFPVGLLTVSASVTPTSSWPIATRPLVCADYSPRPNGPCRSMVRIDLSRCLVASIARINQAIELNVCASAPIARKLRHRLHPFKLIARRLAVGDEFHEPRK